MEPFATKVILWSVISVFMVSATTCTNSASQQSTFVVNVIGVPEGAASLQAFVTLMERAPRDVAKFTLTLEPGKSTTDFAVHIPPEEGQKGQLIVAVGLFRSDNCLASTGFGRAALTDQLTSLDVVVSQVTTPPAPCSDRLPVLTEVNPPRAKTLSGEQLTLRGFGFLPDSTVKIHDEKVAIQTWRSPLEMTGTLPMLPGVTGQQVVKVENVGMEPVQRSDLLTLTISQVDFAPPVEVQPPHFCGPNRVAAVDLSGDGYPELLASGAPGCANGRLVVYTNQRDGTFSPASQEYLTPGNSIGLAVGYFDQDSFVDVAVVSRGDMTNAPKVGVLRGQAGGTFKDMPSEEYPLPLLGWQARDIALGQLTGDSRPELLVSAIDLNLTSQGRLSILRNRGSDFALDSTTSIGYDPYSVRIVDLNQDNQPEVISSQHFGGLWIYPSGNVTGTPTYYGATHIVRNLLVADINKDALPDVILPSYNQNAVAIFLGKSNPTQVPQLQDTPAQYAAQNGPSSAAVADLDQDGALDLLVSNREPAASVTILYGRGDGTFDESRAHHLQIAAGAQPEDIITADLNRDGLPDIVLGTSGASRITILMNQSL